MATKVFGEDALGVAQREELAPTLNQMNELQAQSLEHEWEFEPMALGTVEGGRALLERMAGVSRMVGTHWYSPGVGTDGAGNISLEWRGPVTSLTLFANADGSTESLYSWGSNIWTEIETIVNPDDQQLTELWRKHFKANGKLP